jgi:hypothetical protein
MEAYKNDNLELQEEEQVIGSKLYGYFEKSRSWISATLGIIILVIGIALAFILASLSATKEIKASNRESAYILKIWRESVGDVDGVLFPKEKTDIVQYKDKEYYFVIDKINEETYEILKWHFSYDGDLRYVFEDAKYYILTALVALISILVAVINYRSTVRAEKNKSSFKKSLEYYQKRKKICEKITQYTPDYCAYKYRQMFDIKKREIIEKADINYEYYMSPNFNVNKLEKWQLRRLKKIRKIKIKRMYASDLLQEHGRVQTKVVMLPMGEEEHFRRFLISGTIQKILSAALSGVVIAFGFEFGDWQLGLTYAYMVIASWIGAIVAAGEYVNTTLRNRFISKADYLIEFYNIKEMFIQNSTLPKPVPEKDEHTIIQEEKYNRATEPILGDV